MRELRNAACLGLALGLLIYAVPRLEIGGGWTQPTIFSIGWICMVLVIIAAHLHDILGIDEQTRKQIDQVRLYRMRLQQQLIDRGRSRSAHPGD